MLFGIAVILNAWLLFYDSAAEEVCDLAVLLQTSFITGPSAYILPVLTALPSVMRWHEERTSGAYRSYVLRKGRRRYAFSKILEAAISGALVMILSLVLFTVFVYIYAAAHGMRVTYEMYGMFGSEYDPTLYYRLIIGGKGRLVYLINCLFLVGYGMLWPCIGTAVSVFIRDKRLALASAFLAKRFLEFVTGAAPVLRASNLLLSTYAQSMFLGGIPYAVCYVLVTLLLCTVIVYFGMEYVLAKNG